ncbi:MAG: hypothetical protein GTO51_03355 [Candidatus Latescibacteria bacterium]|nr:hypothetical protein [Candidatus Latescibacterota bacterium]NIM20875.1 hypothetical protein [Candidatus Latescibacterota bacterium]NIM65010.1 hypothetical protein [Candidatus Latescibacterota bacterium]NIO01525.1 hypothetical protein [Candidatus Latescibacterota bacterium]NIO28042.1 hypothetical protein [Candidatus Latescibacterota bacterium]
MKIRRLFIPLALFALLLICLPYLSSARKPIRNAFFGLYPSALGTAIEDLPSNKGHCGVCHYDFDGGGPSNSYGLDVEVARAIYPTDEDA